MLMNYVLSKKRNGTPLLSKEEIEQIAEWCIYNFNPCLLKKPQSLDIDFFVTDHLKLNQDYQYLSHNGIYLGMIAFQDTPVVIYNPEEKRAEIIDAKEGTVIIDNSLLSVKHEHRYRFTMGHEGSHWILHKDYIQRSVNRTIQCRSANFRYKPQEEWTENDTIEWQANYLSSAFLMPRSSVHMFINSLPKIPDLRKIPYYIKEIVKTFDVSYQAAEYRLKSLGYRDQL